MKFEEEDEEKGWSNSSYYFSVEGRRLQKLPPSTGAHSKAAGTFLLLTAQSKVLIVLKDTQHIIYYFIFFEVGVVMDLGQT